MTLVLIVFVALFFVLYCIDNEVGDLLAGTVGVGISVCSTLLIIATLLEQKMMNAITEKHNKQIEIHNNIESFNSKYDDLILYLALIEDGEKTVKDILYELWDDIEDELKSFSFINFENKHTIRNNIDIYNKLKNACKNQKLITISLKLNRLNYLYNKINSYNDNSVIENIETDWFSIDKKIKICAGFYFCWVNDYIKDKNQFTDIFNIEYDEKIPQKIPCLQIGNKQSLFDFDTFSHKEGKIKLESFCDNIIEIDNVKVILSSKPEYYRDIELSEPIKLLVRENRELFLTDFFGHLKLDILHFIAYSKSNLFTIEFSLKYSCEIFIYEAWLEYFEEEENNIRGIIFKQIENDKES